MFTVKANIKPIKVTSFDIIGKKDQSSQCMVFTKTGNYRGYERNGSTAIWKRVLNRQVRMSKNSPSNMGNLNSEVYIAAGSTQAFFIWCESEMLYQRGGSQGSAFASDGSITVSQGVGVEELFRDVTDTAKFCGRIRYVLFYAN